MLLSSTLDSMSTSLLLSHTILCGSIPTLPLLSHSPSVLYPFYPIHPVSYPLIISPLLNFLPKPLSSSPLSWVVDWFWWLVWLSGLCSFYSCFVFLCRFYGWLVLLCFGFIGSVGLVWVCFLLYFFSPYLPHSPSVPSTFFYPSLKITYQAQSFGAGISESDEK